MVITVTLNPALDKTIVIDNFKPGAINRVEKIEDSPGGKGINVAKILQLYNKEVINAGILGGKIGQKISDKLGNYNLNTLFTESPLETRQNIKILDKKTDQETAINETGRVSPEAFFKFKEDLQKQLSKTDLLILAGSLPSDLPGDSYNQLIALAKNYGVKTLIDTDKPMKKSIEAGPYLFKQNINEAERLSNNSLNSINRIKEFSEYLFSLGIKFVVITAGCKGSFLARREKKIWVTPPQVDISKTTVGAGDTMLAGLVMKLEGDNTLEEIGRFATALATGYVMSDKIDKLKIRASSILKKVKVEVI